MSIDPKTVDSYNKHAKTWSEYFSDFGPRTYHIDIALQLAGADDGRARVVEIGCGDGRDASEIVKKVAWYEGFDPAEDFLKLAKDKLPGTNFKVSNAIEYNFPGELDVVYAFASLLHINRDDVQTVLQKVHKSLRKGGVFMISLKERPGYEVELDSRKLGERTFYYYNPKLINELSGDLYEMVHEGHQNIGKTHWFTVALRKV